MPVAGGTGVGQARTRRVKRQEKRTYTPPAKHLATSRAAERYYSRPTPTPPRPVRAKPVSKNVFGQGPFAVTRKPFAKQQKQAARKTVRAQLALPERPLPALPTIRGGYTPEQRRTAGRLVRRSVRAQARAELPRRPQTGKPARKLGARDTTRIYEALDQDPRSILRKAPLETAGRAEAQKRYIAQAQRAGVPKGTSTSTLVAIGRALAARDQGRAAPPKMKIQAAGISITPKDIGRAVGSVTSLGKGDIGPRRFSGRVWSNAKTLTTAPIVLGVEAARAGRDVARYLPDAKGVPLYGRVARGEGSTVRGKRLVKQTAKGAYESGKELVTDPIGSFERDPLLTALSVTGAVGVGGRIAGTVARGVGKAGAPGVRGKLAEAGSTRRPSLASIDDPGAVREGRGVKTRRGSKSLTTAAAQRRLDQFREEVVDKKGNPILDPHGQPVLKMTKWEAKRHQRKEADFEEGRALTETRAERERIEHEEAPAGRTKARIRRAKGKSDEEGVPGRAVFKSKPSLQDAVTFVMRGTVRNAATFIADLEKTRARWAKNQTAVAQQNVKRIDYILKRTRDNPDLIKAIVEQGMERGRRQNESEDEVVIPQGVLSDRQRAEHARTIDYQIEHMGGRFYTKKQLKQLEAKGASVRSPEAERRYQDAQAKIGQAKQVEKRANQRVTSAIGGLNRARGRKDAKAIEQWERKVADAREFADTAKRNRVDTQRYYGKVQRPQLVEGIRGKDHRPITLQQVHAHMRDETAEPGSFRDPKTVAYLPTDRPGRGGFFRPLDPTQGRGQLDKRGKRKTGVAYERGDVETGSRVIVENRIRQATATIRARQIDAVVRGGLKRENGKHFTGKEAERFIHHWHKDQEKFPGQFTGADGKEWVAVRAHPAMLNEQVKQAVREAQDTPSMETLQNKLLDSRVLKDDENLKAADNVVLVPAAKIDRMRKHANVRVPRSLAALNRAFRMAVLPQPRWLTGNITEPFGVRLTVEGSGMNLPGLAADLRMSKKLIAHGKNSDDPDVRAAMREVEAQQATNGLFVGNRAAGIRTLFEDLPDPVKETYAKIVSAQPWVEQAADLAQMVGKTAMAPLRGVMRLNRVMEGVSQKAAFGRTARRELQTFGHGWTKTVKLQKEALDELAKGLVDTPKQHQWMLEQQKILGQYQNFSPAMRFWVSGATPFLPWVLNSLRFTYWTMPTSHPAVTAALVQGGEVLREEFEREHEQVKGLGSLAYAVPTEDGGWVDLARYTPYALAAESDGNPFALLQSMTEQFAPQVRGSAAALSGLDPWGRPLSFPKERYPGQEKLTAGQAAGVAGYGLAEAITPYLSTIRRLREGGGTSYSTSTVLSPQTKPGTKRMSAFQRTFDPFRPTYLNAAPAPQARRRARARKRRAPKNLIQFE